MQTFLPYANFIKSAKSLDYRRLGKQRVECKQILQCLLGEGSLRWKNHPAVKMWKGYEEVLACYAYHICDEWRERGYKDTLLPFFEKKLQTLNSSHCPSFLNDTKFHLSHQSNLIRKKPEHYRPQFGYDVPDDLPYIWQIDNA